MTASRDETTVVLRKRDLRGSRLRCLMLNSMPREQVAATLTQLVAPLAAIDPQHDHWMPGGFLEPEEAKLGECPRFLSNDLRRKLTAWWLKQTKGANTPNWDLVSTCRVNGEPGFILVEAKAHDGEAKEEGKQPGNAENDQQILTAIEEANRGLNAITPGWQLSRDSHYQLCNRFAWAWKLSTLGVPTILICLGFLHATEMSDHGRAFDSAQGWDTVIREHSSGVVPAAAWECRLQTSAAPMWALIRSLDLRWVATSHLEGAGSCL